MSETHISGFHACKYLFKYAYDLCPVNGQLIVPLYAWSMQKIHALKCRYKKITLSRSVVYYCKLFPVL